MTSGQTGDDAVLSRARYRGNPVSVDHATDAELDATTNSPDPASARNLLPAWSLIAVCGLVDRGAEVHALGWRVDLVNTWISSALVGVDLEAQAVSTKSGHAYRLWGKNELKLAPSPRDHLAYALHTWGFTDVGL